MFCDLVGSTALAARLDPEDLREVIGAYHRRIAKVVRYDGFVAKYMGDGVLVYFGYRIMGITKVPTGDVAATLAHFDRSLGLYDTSIVPWRVDLATTTGCRPSIGVLLPTGC